MSFSYLVGFDQLSTLLAGGNLTETKTIAKCPEPINRQWFFLFMLIPACICTGLLTFTKKRKNLKTERCGGRPALIFPQDMMGRSNRISQAAAYGCIVSISYEVIFDGKYAFNYTGPVYLKVFVALASMLIYGVDYYPLFASLSLDNMIGYFIGTLYAWTLAIVEFYKTFKCDHLTPETIGLIIARNWPQLVCHLYLCFSLPTRLIITFIKRNDPPEKTVEEYLMNSYSGIHVRKIFRRPPPPPPEPCTIPEKILALLKDFATKFLYSRASNFRYSGRILSVITVAFILMYTATAELLIFLIPVFKFLELVLWDDLQQLPDDDPSVESQKQMLHFAYYILHALEACFLTSLFLAFIVNCIGLLHSLSTYRLNLMSLYKGKPNYLTTKDENSNHSLLIGSMKYAGYQVAYIAWGFFVQFIIVFLVSIILATVIILIKLKIVDDWFLDKFNAVWPVLLTTFCVNFMQTLMAKYVFLQDMGNSLAIDNRRLFFIVVYFMFFYNIFLGLVSCLLRIIKAIVTGAFLLPRLDHSTLPRRFQFLDPGFTAYCGFMHVECAHTNPVAKTFIRVLQVEAYGKSGKISESSDNFINMEAVAGDKASEDANRRHRQVIFRWKLVYTLLRNPELIIRRKTELLKALELLGMEKIAQEGTKKINNEGTKKIDHEGTEKLSPEKEHLADTSNLI